MVLLFIFHSIILAIFEFLAKLKHNFHQLLFNEKLQLFQLVAIFLIHVLVFAFVYLILLQFLDFLHFL